VQNKLALIVEDNMLLSSLFSRALKDIEFETLVLSDGKKAREWLQTGRPDILLLDMHLPYVSGKQIFDEIYDDPRFKGMYTVVITADARMGEILSEKASFVLIKPVDIQQLQQLAERLKN